jgi:hypothetical protein
MLIVRQLFRDILSDIKSFTDANTEGISSECWNAGLS